MSMTPRWSSVGALGYGCALAILTISACGGSSDAGWPEPAVDGSALTTQPMMDASSVVETGGRVPDREAGRSTADVLAPEATPAADAGTASAGDAGADLPPPGQSWMLIGQDVGSIEDYARRVRPPGGVVGYTSLDTLVGVVSVANWGAGDQSLLSLAGEFPGRPVSLGLFLVNPLSEITSGSLDAQIDSLAGTLAGLGRSVLLRIGYEFDNPSNGYDPANYQAAFVHIVERVRAAGARLVRSVWQSQASCQPSAQTLAAWYPGDSVVDWVGLSYFTQYGVCKNASVDAVVAFARSRGKPVFVAESTPQGYDLTAMTYSATGSGIQSETASEVWGGWFRPYFALIHANQDVIRAVAYVDADWEAQPMWQSGDNGYWGDSRVQQNAAIQQMWTTELQGTSWVQP
jgi:hypothetical protein